MTTYNFDFGFRTEARDGERRLVNWNAAFVAHIENDPRAATPGECYLSHFQFGNDFREYLAAKASTKGFSGPTFARWLGFDIDRADSIDEALSEARRLVASLEMRLGVDSDCLLIFFSGSKGFHILLPTWLFNPEPAIDFHAVARSLCVALAQEFGIPIDEGVYSRVNLFRAPNSRHRKTGLFKRQLSSRELFNLSADAILKLASEPAESEIPSEGDVSPEAVELWHRATREVAEAKARTPERRDGKAKLNPLTRALLRGELPTEGDRHRLVFSAVADLAECGSMDELIRAVITDPALNTGLPAADVERQIRCGIQHGGRRS